MLVLGVEEGLRDHAHGAERGAVRVRGVLGIGGLVRVLPVVEDQRAGLEGAGPGGEQVTRELGDVPFRGTGVDQVRVSLLAVGRLDGSEGSLGRGRLPEDRPGPVHQAQGGTVRGGPDPADVQAVAVHAGHRAVARDERGESGPEAEPEHPALGVGEGGGQAVAEAWASVRVAGMTGVPSVPA